ncbi:MAG: hypothetical protein GY950_16045 [bacterium]|nr:hypothetical protein [bacterium]
MMKLKKTALPVLIGILVILMNMNAYSYIELNGAGGGYGDGDSGEKAAATNDGNNPIENYIVVGAGYFLAANADIQVLLRLVELQDIQGMDTGELSVVSARAAANMKNAVNTYEKLVDAAEMTPYNPYVQSALMNFDYDAFMLQNGLNAALFPEVKGFLEKGDITGTFKRTHTALKEILGMLNGLKDGTAQNKLPDVSLLRQLNEACAESSLFGSYVARIFSEIR